MGLVGFAAGTTAAPVSPPTGRRRALASLDTERPPGRTHHRSNRHSRPDREGRHKGRPKNVGRFASAVTSIDTAMPMSRLAVLRVPLPWDEFGLPNPLQTRSTVLVTGPIGWAWDGPAPAFDIDEVPEVDGTAAPGWDLDHVVLLVPSLDAAIGVFADAGLTPRLKVDVRGRPTAFFRVGPLLEVIESAVRGPAIYGVALVTDEPLEVVALRWRSMGRDVTDPKPAIQPGRRIMTVRAVEAGLAVMTPDRDVTAS